MSEKKEKKTKKKKHGVLKFFISMILILGAAGSAFWFGWIQFRLNEGEYAVIYTKTGGYDDKVIKNGEFVWRWEALLPTNLTLHIFKPEVKTLNISKSGTLPSGNIYAILLNNENVNFNWDFSALIRYTLIPEALPEIVKNGEIEGSLDSLYSFFEAKAEKAVSGVIDSVFTSPETAGDYSISDLEERIQKELSLLDSSFKILNVSITNLEYPDPLLYVKLKQLAFEYLSNKEKAISETESVAIKREGIQNEKLELLEKYGKILNEYPVLIQLFSLEGNPAKALLPPEKIE